MSVDTRKVERRSLHFSSLEDVGAEVDRLGRGKIQHRGNWTPGQIFKHLAVTMDNSIDGFPFQYPLPFRVLARLLFKGRLMRKGMTPGFQLPARASAILPPPIGVEEGLAAIRKALGRQKTETRRAPSPFLGSLTLDEWNQIHCRHAELHLGFLVPEA
jgi:hypothetical protein